MSINDVNISKWVMPSAKKYANFFGQQERCADNGMQLAECEEI